MQFEDGNLMSANTFSSANTCLFTGLYYNYYDREKIGKEMSI